MTWWMPVLAALLQVGSASQPTFRAGIDIVRLDVSVMNGPSPVPGLTHDNFLVFDNGVQQSIDAVAIQNAPINLTLLLDTSDSMREDRLNNLIIASQKVVKALSLIHI